MVRHQPSGDQRLGLLYATITMLVWSVLPHVLKILLTYIDPFSLTWYRFFFASSVFFVLLRRRGELPTLGALTRKQLVLLGAAIAGLAANYIFFLVGLDLTSPATSQVLIQIGPVVLALGGIVIFHERFTRVQWLGFAILLAGLGVFFGSQISELAGRASEAEQYRLGVLVIVAAALTWAGYGLAQKQLLLALPSQPLMFCLFVGCTVLYTPMVDLRAIASFDALGFAALGIAACATAAAYGSFSAALEHIEASRVSAVIALVPLGTLASSLALSAVVPELVPPVSLSALSFAGAGAVVAGSLITALGGTSASTTES
ncbi:MAG: drug/metabolite transporter (DMT)-like permease [Myxococcota bacterium]|jgi:drug/metabolite transporter (DMT)-like permease